MAQQDRLIQTTVRKYRDRLFGFIRGRVNSDVEAEDVLQDVWYQFSKLVDASQIENISAWLFRVARNRVTDLYRKKKDSSLEDLYYEDGEGEVRFLDLFLSDAETPESEFIRQAFWEELFDALDELPAKQRDVFIWNELDGETFREIAERTGENIKTLISRKQYAVKHLRVRLELFYEEIIGL